MKEEQEELDKAINFGEKLRQIREMKNLSAREIADQMNISEQNILNIEQGCTDNVPMVFFRDYVRAYVKMIGADESEAEQYLQQIKNHQTKKEKNYLLPDKAKKTRKKFWWGLIFLVLVIVGGISVFDYYKNHQESTRIEIGYYIAEPPSRAFDS